jgi:threonine aldolase
VTFCLSKGLGCPAGSVVAGSKPFIGRAHRARKLLGGGMRQAGILAAAGLVALQDGRDGMIDRLADDHTNARRLAEGLADLPGIVSAGGVAQPEPGRLDPDRVVTNFVLFKVDRDRRAFIEALRARNVLMDEYAHGQVRAATHHDVAATDIDTIVAAVRGALGDTSAAPADSGIAEEQLQGV